MLRDSLAGSSQTMTNGAWRRLDFDATFPTIIGSKDPHALKIPARRAECSLMENSPSPFHAEPRQIKHEAKQERSCTR